MCWRSVYRVLLLPVAFFYSLHFLHIVALLFDCLKRVPISGYVVHAALQCTGISTTHIQHSTEVTRRRRKTQTHSQINDTKNASKRNLKSRVPIELLLLLLLFSYSLSVVSFGSLCCATVIALQCVSHPFNTRSFNVH